MNGLSKILGRGMLILALGSCAFACGDDDTSDTGGGAGSGGDDGGPAAGTGAGGDDGGPAAGTGGGGAVTVEECKETAATNTGGMASDECLTCVCTADADATSACTADCWSLVLCVANDCGGDASNLGCITTACADFIGAATPAMAFGPVIMGCRDMCETAPGGDGGGDGG